MTVSIPEGGDNEWAAGTWQSQADGDSPPASVSTGTSSAPRESSQDSENCPTCHIKHPGYDCLLRKIFVGPGEIYWSEPLVEPTPRHASSARLHQILKELGELHDRKQADYGTEQDPFANVRASEDFGVPAWVGALVRLNDKIVRLKSFARKGALANESAEDSMKDIAVYALIALVLYEEAGK